jgi:predicted O-methyltransferase YrrM
MHFLKTIFDKILRKSFSFFQLIGVHVVPLHFYDPIPDTRKLKKEVWEEKSSLCGINLNEEKQKSLIADFVKGFKNEYDSLVEKRFNEYGNFNVENSEFKSVDAEILYCMIRQYRPKNIIEIGSGYSTVIMAKAIEKNIEEYHERCSLTSIDPYPKDFIKNMPSFFKLIRDNVQNVDTDKFNILKNDDILFIDSSHVLKTGSDVQYEYLRLLPKINNGVIIHAHDIFFPAEYPKDWILKNKLFFNEQYILHAFLLFNEEFEILWAGSHMHLKFPKLLENSFKSYSKEKSWPGSFWIRRK